VPMEARFIDDGAMCTPRRQVVVRMVTTPLSQHRQAGMGGPSAPVRSRKTGYRRKGAACRKDSVTAFVTCQHTDSSDDIDECAVAYEIFCALAIAGSFKTASHQTVLRCSAHAACAVWF
jgi:hypothetical protein